MSALAEALLTLLALGAAVPAAVLLLEVLAAGGARAPVSAIAFESGARRPRLAVLVPAHDEEAGIAATLRSVRAQLRDDDRILVVADNCSDATAAAARAEGALVVERTDTVRRGKGYALDFGVRSMEGWTQTPQVVVIVDADCLLDPGALDALARRAEVSGRPVQAAYLMRPPTSPSLRQRISAFAWVVRNLVRPAGAARLGWPCQLMGTGMAFPWRALAGAPLASGHLVEDLQLGVAFAQAGTPPLFCREAGVSSTFPSDERAAIVQRTRWEHGHLSILLRAAPRLLASGVARGRSDLVGMALDLAVPPLALLMAATVGLLVLTTALALLTGAGWPLAIAALALGMLAAAVILAALRHGRGLVSAGDLLRVPLYVAGKLPIYGRWLRNRQDAWIRTRR